MIAALPMYDWPQIRDATDRFWAALSGAMRARGLDAPEALERRRDAEDVWRDPDLLFSQTCGHPFATVFRGTLRLVAIPVHDAEGCRGATYSSAIVVRAGDDGSGTGELRGRRAAFNAVHSQSGYSALRLTLAPFAESGRFLSETIETGSHLASMEAVAAGVADCAAIDAVVWALARRHRPQLARALRVLAWTTPAPALPFVTAIRRDDREVAAMREALAEVFADPELSATCTALLLKGAEPAADTVYDVLLDMARAADEAGYPQLR
jgi:ABC-type phosphate/phosphonate transport system substrate-binding protein